jgi:hypothetical protein
MTIPKGPLVPNPRYTELKNLLNQLAQEESTLRNTFRDACRRMGSNDVWIGPTARAWQTKIGSYDAQLRQLLSRAIADVQAELAGTPKEVDPRVQ